MPSRKAQRREVIASPVSLPPFHAELQLEAEIGRRATAQSRLKPLLVPAKVVAARIPLLNEGTVVTLVTLQPSDHLNGLAAAIKAGNAEQARVYADAIAGRTRREYLQRKKRLDVTTAPLVIDIQYGSTWVAKHMVLAEPTSIAVSCATWSGGKLDEEKFAAIEHTRRKTKGVRAHVLTLLVPPTLSKVEQGLLRAVPSALDEAHVKGPSVSWSAAGVSARWDAPVRGDRLAFVPSWRVFEPFYEKVVQQTTMQQQQVQQNDTHQQQQQQQFQDNHTQQQQQQIQQQDNQQQVEQQVQHEQEQVQQQQQQYQNDDGQQDQHQYQNRHANDCAQQQESGMFWDDLDGGLVFQHFERVRYMAALEQINFQELEATQSVKELLRLRERLITIGMP